MDIKRDYNITESESSVGIIKLINMRLESKTKSIESYSRDLCNPDYTDEEKSLIREMIDDERDHLVLLTAMLEDRVGNSSYTVRGSAPFDMTESVVVETSTASDQLLRWVTVNLGLDDPSIEDGTYTYSLPDSKEYGRVYSKLEKINSIVEVRQSSMTTDDYSSTQYKRSVDPKFTINLLGDFKNDEYSLIVVEE